MNKYPMKTTIDGAIVRNLRLVAGEQGTTVWMWDRDADSAVPLRQSSKSPRRIGASQRWEVQDLVVEPQRGCGCQHPMHTFVPPEDERR